MYVSTLFNLRKALKKKKIKGGGEGMCWICNAESWAGNRPQGENALAGEDPQVCLIPAGSLLRYWSHVPQIRSLFKGLFPKRAVFVLTNRRHVFELELVETGWLLRQNVIDARLAASKGR